MGSARLLLLCVLQPVIAQEPCNVAAESCAEGVEGVVDSRSMLALKQKRASIALTANDAEEGYNTKPFSMGSNEGKAKKCTPEVTGLMCETQEVNGQRFQIERPESHQTGYLKADYICATKVKLESGIQCWYRKRCGWYAKYCCKDGETKYCVRNERRGRSGRCKSAMRYQTKEVQQHEGWKEDLVIRCRSPDSFQLRSDSNFSKCLDWAQSHNDNILMWTCHNGNNQKWFWAGSQLRSVADKTKCITKWGWNVKAMECLKRGSKDQKIIDWDKKLEFDSGNCLDWDHGGWYGKTNVLNWRCHWGNNQKWTKLASHLE